MYYSLLPGVNQYIEKSGSQGQNLFRKHGYNLGRRPNHHDYYKALQDDRREGFFDDLASALGSVAKVWGATSSASGSRAPSLGGSNNTTSDSLASLGTSSPFQAGGIPSNSGIYSHYGGAQGGVPRGAGRNAAYLELVNHFRNESIRRGYMAGLEQEAYYQVIPPVYGVGVQFGNDDQQAVDPKAQVSDSDSGNGGNDYSFGMGDIVKDITRPVLIIGAIILALLIWRKLS